MKLVQTVYTGDCWMSGDKDVDQCVETALVYGDGSVLGRVSFSEGESEDMTLNRNLSDAYDIYDLVKRAYELGKEGVELSFETKTEEY